MLYSALLKVCRTPVASLYTRPLGPGPLLHPQVPRDLHCGRKGNAWSSPGPGGVTELPPSRNRLLVKGWTPLPEYGEFQWSNICEHHPLG